MPCRARPRGESVTVAKSAAEADPRGWGGAYTRPVSVWETGVICKFCCALLFAREPEGPVLYPETFTKLPSASWTSWCRNRRNACTSRRNASSSRCRWPSFRTSWRSSCTSRRTCRRLLDTSDSCASCTSWPYRTCPSNPASYTSSRQTCSCRSSCTSSSFRCTSPYSYNNRPYSAAFPLFAP